MKKLLLILFTIPLLSFTAHKYYLSVTDVEYNEAEKSIQIITRLFYDDLEDVLKERYDENIVVDATSDQEVLDKYIGKYLGKKLQITINGALKMSRFLGKEFEDDYVVCYIEISEIEEINTFEIENTLLMDLFPEQKNMVHTDILTKKKSLMLESGNAKAVLNFSK